MKYLWAYSVPIIGLLGIHFQGVWCWSAMVYAFVIIPVAETLMPLNTDNYTEGEIENRLKNKLFDVLLYLNVLIVYGSIYYTAYKVTHTVLTYTELTGVTFSLGIILASNGINVGHELGHRKSTFEKILGKLLLIPSHYTHFFIEHNHGHHLHVSTPNDPSTAKYNQTLYAFWWQTVTGTYREAWKIQFKLNQLENRKIYSIKSDMFWFTLIQIGYVALAYILFGFIGFVVISIAGIIGFLMLETINYIEHYGLKRNVLPSGRFERVSEKHSWNSNHVLGRIVLYELTRHSDHHYKSQKEYQILEYHDVSPQMPYGYPTSMVLSFIPPLWFAIMNKRVPLEMK
jgi:alkane 1-monooxygenase